MKNVILTVFALFSFATINAQKENSVKVNPLGLFLGSSDMITYERALTENISAVIGGGYGSVSLAGTSYTNSGFGVQGRYYFTEILNSWYGALKVNYSSAKVNTDADTVNIDGGSAGSVNIDSSGNISTGPSADLSGLSIGAVVGKQWVYGSGFTLDLNLGVNKVNYKAKASDGVENTSGGFSGILPTGAIALGYSF